MADLGNSSARASAGPLSYARWANVALGAWLFVSAFLWVHAGGSFTNTWIMGIVLCGFALVGIVNPAARFVNTAAGAWVFISAFLLPHVTAATVWNNAMVGALAFLISLVPNLVAAGGISSP